MKWITNTLQHISTWVTAHKRIFALLGGAVIAMVLGLILTSGQDEEVQTDPVLPVVTMTTSGSLASDSSISLIGTVRSFTEAAVTAERGGRVTSVRTNLGDTVGAGQVLVTLENAAEAAAVLQAEGSYESALAAAASSDISLDDSESNLQTTLEAAVNSIRSSYTTSNAAIKTNVDLLLGNPDSSNPWLKISGAGRSSELVHSRVAIGERLLSWQARISSLTVDSDLETELRRTSSDIDHVITVLDAYIVALSDRENSSQYSSQLSSLVAKRSELQNLQSNLIASIGNIKSAKENVNRANIAASGGTTSAADAQVKSALGSLRAAQANYAKTILRAPVSGTVNELPVRVGDFIGPQTKVAEVANNSALEIVTYASDAELFALQPGDTVLVDNRYEGVITTISPAVDVATGKTEVRIASDNDAIKNGSTVRITAAVTADDVADSTVRVPLSAIKFEREAGFMFTVVEDKLKKFPVELGAIFGGEVVIENGLSATDTFVIDARGLREGEAVEIAH